MEVLNRIDYVEQIGSTQYKHHLYVYTGYSVAVHWVWLLSKRKNSFISMLPREMIRHILQFVTSTNEKDYYVKVGKSLGEIEADEANEPNEHYLMHLYPSCYPYQMIYYAKNTDNGTFAFVIKGNMGYENRLTMMNIIYDEHAFVQMRNALIKVCELWENLIHQKAENISVIQCTCTVTSYGSAHVNTYVNAHLRMLLGIFTYPH